MPKKTLISAILAVGLFVVLLYYRDVLLTKFRNIGLPDQVIKTCFQFSNQDIRATIDEINRDRDSYVRSEKNIMDLSTEGGIQTNYTDKNGNLKFIQQIFYGETGKSETSYYLKDNKVLFISKQNFTYQKPIHEDPDGNIKKTEVKEFYLGDGHLCRWYLDGSLQQNDTDTQELVSFLVSTLDLKKESVSCPNLSVDNIQAKATEIDHNLNQYVYTKKDVASLTSRGGTQITYSDQESAARFIHQIFYDESFRSEIKYYLSGEKVFFITVDRFTYEKPIYMDSNIKVHSVVTRDFYLNENEELCMWYLDKDLQEDDSSTEDFIRFLLTTLQ